MTTVDLNADLGESFGAYTLGEDEAMLALVTSANIACGFHAGGPDVMARTVAAAVHAGVALGAHPGLPDLAGFGRRVMAVTPEEGYNLTTYQIGALAAFARRHGRNLQHVKPHGALYNTAERQPPLAQAIAQAVRDFDGGLFLFALSGGVLAQAGRDLGLRIAQEVFADRTYQADGALTPRTSPDALIHDPAEAARRMVRLLTEGVIVTADGTEIALTADTICLHGDQPGAAARAQVLRQELERHGIAIRPPGEDVGS
ncbi:MAG: LamB/YcsF family protein [Armatimonadota bacterium]|nr:LamB/YcsF family protein [Armatimonadota bacterium]